MAAVSHGARHLRQGVGVAKSARSIHTPAFTPRTSTLTPNRLFAETRTFLSRLASHLFTPSVSTAVAPQPALLRPTQLNSQGIHARFSLPVKHALSRPFSPPRLPKPTLVPANVTQVGLGTARAFHSGRPIFQDMVDNVPIATRALWEAEWDVKTKKKEERRLRRVAQTKTVPKSREMLKPKLTPVMTGSELDAYFPVQPLPSITTHLLVPLAPTPTARLPLSARVGGDTFPLLPIADLASIHTTHRLHSLRVSTLFARLDTANVWDDPGVNVDAYAFGPRHGTQEKQCTILRVTFRGWDTARVRSIIGNSSEEWYVLEETRSDGPSASVPIPDPGYALHMNKRSESPSLESIADFDIGSPSQTGKRDSSRVLSPPHACASAQHDLVFPTLDFSSAFSDAVDTVPPPPQPVVFLRTISELTSDTELASQSLTDPWKLLGNTFEMEQV